MSEEVSLRLDASLTVAAVVVGVAGLLTALSGGQVLAFFVVDGPGRFVPWVMIALGLVGCLCVPGLSVAEVRAAGAATFATGAAALTHVGWAAWAGSQGVLSPLQILATGATVLAAPVAAAAVPPAWRYQRARAALLAESDGLFRRDDDDSPWPMLISGTLAGTLAGPFVLAIIAPLVADRLWLQISAGLHGVAPTQAGVFTSSHDDFSYAESPFVIYLDREAALVPVDAARALGWVDDIAWEVGLRMLLETGAEDVVAAEQALWDAERGKDVPLWIAQAIRTRGTFYHLESLLSRSFDPEIHRPGAEVHLDCDQLVYVFAHVGQRLDLDLRPVPGAMHVYLRYDPPEDGEPLTVEATGFRNDEDDGAFGSVEEEFFIPASWHREGRGGVRASRSLVAAADLFEPASEERITDLIVGELAYGMMKRHPEVDVLPMLRAELAGTRDYTLVTNLHASLVESAEARLKEDHPAEAVVLAQEAVALRRDYPGLIAHGDLTEALVQVQALAATGDKAAAAEATRVALRAYAALGADPWRPNSRTHRQIAEMATELGVARDSL